MSKFKEEKIVYRRLGELNIPVYNQPVAHVKPIELDIGLLRAGLDKTIFDKLFGVQTCPLVDGEGCLYPWDTEAVLERMMSGRLTGTQLYWD